MERIFKLKPLEQVVVQFLLLIWALIVALPFGLAFINSVKGNLGQVIRSPFGLPQEWHFENYLSAWEQANFSSYFLNSLIISLGTVVLAVAFSTMVAFVLARVQFRGNKLIFILFMLGVIVPLRLAMAPLFVVVQSLDLLNSLLGIILVQAASMMPVAVFILSTFFKNLSPEIEQAARVDGALPFQIYWRIVLPLVKPAIATVALLSFVSAWNEYIFPLLFLQDRDLYPLTLGLQEFQNEFAIQWHMMFAGLIIMMAPTLIAFLLASKAFIQGLTQGGIKE
ncbi:sugar ABC transporter permease [Vibrio nigripulchritudo]|uniref:carbohydrate ABC transporter permease n=1 Tax=Vibrio nigripulchritudo TaxID=28173 RepID=UPI0005F9F863|nr:carbohydrate ABC transporter permease [Vibrio nigripulchritudo]KJY72456.1 ABC transporter permease [Vibrio nigripulchritudo]BCL71080.1 sugar ABC transporter permease [Vibrio nigripulchritudo]BDU32436.1 sugar ABC transporter permease [Vibrio nigripulchritudo]